MRNAVADLKAGELQPGSIKHIGLDDEAAVRLVLHADVPDAVKAQVEALADDIRSGKVVVSTTWEGDEFATPE